MASRAKDSLPFVNVMRPNIEGDYFLAADVEDRPQITLNHDRMNSLLHYLREFVDFVRVQSGIERILLEDQPCPPCGFLLLWRQAVEIPPKPLGCAEPIIHETAGGFSLSAVSMSTSRPSSASSIPRHASSGTSGFSNRRNSR